MYNAEKKEATCLVAPAPLGSGDGERMLGRRNGIAQWGLGLADGLGSKLHGNTTGKRRNNGVDGDTVGTGVDLELGSSLGSGPVVRRLVITARRRVITASAKGATTVELDAVTRAGDSVAFACAVVAATGGDAGGSGVVGGPGRGERGHIAVSNGSGGRRVVGVAGLHVKTVELVNPVGIVGVLAVDDAARLMRLHGLGRNDLVGRHTTTASNADVDGETGPVVRRSRRSSNGGSNDNSRGGGGGNIKDVEGTSSSGLNSSQLGGVVDDLITVNNVVVPVAGSGDDARALELEDATPGTITTTRVDLKGELALVVVPRTDKMDVLDAGGGSDTELELDRGSRHVEKREERRGKKKKKRIGRKLID